MILHTIPRNYKKQIAYGLLLGAILYFSFQGISAFAGVNESARGYAWGGTESANGGYKGAGWISMNSLSESSSESTRGFAWGGSESANGAYKGAGWISMSSVSDGSSVDYGVIIPSSDGPISGYAWSEHYGWISFNAVDLGGCNPALLPAMHAGNSITGGARILAIRDSATPGGYDGCVSLSGPGYGLTVTGSASPYQVTGYAWSGDIGWIDFRGGQAQGVEIIAAGSGADYGVNIPSVDGPLSGNAWSEHYGWVAFDGFNTGACGAPATRVGNNIHGFARVLASNSAGFDGCLSLSGPGYGVTIDTVANPNKLGNYGWSSDLGWIEFSRVTLAPICSNGQDDDGDGLADSADPDCKDPLDNTEGPETECSDGVDNADPEDVATPLADFGSGPTNDPGCSSLTDNDETDPPIITQFEVCDVGGANCSKTKNAPAGTNLEIRWTATNADQCDRQSGPTDFSTGGNVSGTDGIISNASNGVTDVYEILCSRGTNFVRDTARVRTAGPDITVDKRIVDIGGSVTLSWTTGGALGCVLTGGGKNINIDAVAPDTDETATINAQTTFTLSCGALGTDTVTVNVTGWQDDT